MIKERQYKERETYDVDYFIRKFEKIDSKYWTTKTIGSGGGDEIVKHCILGHCSDEYGKYSKQIQHALFSILYNPVSINDGLDKRYKQDNPKDRILAALYAVKTKQKYWKDKNN